MAMNRFPIKAVLGFALVLTAALLSLEHQSKRKAPLGEASLGEASLGEASLGDPAAEISLEAPSQAGPTVGRPDQVGREAVLEQLALADQQWVPKAERLANGSTRFSYERRAGDPSLSIEQIKDLMENPPTFSIDRQSISRIWEILDRAGVDIRFTRPRKEGAAGEWDPQVKTIRIQPEVIGLTSDLPQELEFVLEKPQYRNTSPQVKNLEREAFANQSDLDLGASLVQAYCF
jgi:hypothetical protein